MIIEPQQKPVYKNHPRFRYRNEYGFMAPLKMPLFIGGRGDIEGDIWALPARGVHYKGRDYRSIKDLIKEQCK